ncbi:hypothetical protein C1G87_1369 [Dehalococcoides mccartyi]|nr:hypothetical protein C1G87_1369 [Dehalococcoides mccartyi]
MPAPINIPNINGIVVLSPIVFFITGLNQNPIQAGYRDPTSL